MKIRLDAIVFDAGTQIRAAIDQQVVSDYAEAMTNGAQFPPIVLFHDGNQHYLADGFHRFMAAQRNQFRDIDAEVRAGTKEDALWFALGANRENGQRLTYADKTHAVMVALQMWPTRLHSDIAAQIGCSKSLVSKASSKFTSESGQQALTGRALQNEEKRDAVRTLVKKGGLSRHQIAEQAEVSPSFVSKVRAEMGETTYDRSRSGVIRRRTRMRTMAEGGYTSRQIADAVGMSIEGCRDVLRSEGIDVPADRAVGKIKRHDSNRIVNQIVADADNLTEGVELVEFAELDRSAIAGWLTSLQDSRDKLGAFIRRLMKEQQKHGEAA